MFRRPPRSTPFPTRRSSDLPDRRHRPEVRRMMLGRTAALTDTGRKRRHNEDEHVLRSEEHTSELQSRVDLVCRLLLEKKKLIKLDRLWIKQDGGLGDIQAAT